MNKELNLKIDRFIIGKLFSPMPITLWIMMSAIISYFYTTHIKPYALHINLLMYGWGFIIFVISITMVLWCFISDNKSNLISAIVVPLIGRMILEVFLMTKFSEDYLFFGFIVALTIAAMFFYDIICDLIIESYKLDNSVTYDDNQHDNTIENSDI